MQQRTKQAGLKETAGQDLGNEKQAREHISRPTDKPYQQLRTLQVARGRLSIERCIPDARQLKRSEGVNSDGRSVGGPEWSPVEGSLAL